MNFMDAPTPPVPPVGKRPHSPQPYPFLANNVWADLRDRPRRWPWVVFALVCGVALAILVTDWEDLPFFKTRVVQKEPKLLPTALATTPLQKNDSDDNGTVAKPEKEAGPIVQVDRSGPIPKLPGSTPELAKYFVPLTVEQQVPKASSPELTMQTGIVRLPPLSILKIYFPKPYREAPVVKLMCDTVMPSEVTIDEMTVSWVVIRNAHTTNECYFRYYAEGKLREAETK